jgi:predicted HTH transcriptional regulator
MYIPPFTVSAEAINLIAEISGQIERYAIRLEGMTQRGAEKLMKRLKEAGVISREGSRKNGIWIINK